MPSEPIDRPVPVRAGEELDVAALAHYLRTELPELTGSLEVAQFPGGYSNLTYALRMGDREMVLRRPPFGAEIKSAHDMGREYRVLRGLFPVYPKVPRPLLFCAETDLIGAPFYVMERVQGVILRPRGEHVLTPDQFRRLGGAAIDNLAALHALDVHSAGLAELGRPEGYVDRQIDGWTQRYRRAQTDEIAALDEVIAWLDRNRPPETAAALIHNDYKYDNLVLDPNDPTQIVAVLDWEMCTLGDPLMDLGTTLGYWIEPTDPAPMVEMFGLTALPGNLLRREVVERYATASGRDVAAPLFYYVYGVFKIAVIVQQIYMRYRKGHTQDPRFAPLIHVVAACAEMAHAALAAGRISGLG